MVELVSMAAVSGAVLLASKVATPGLSSSGLGFRAAQLHAHKMNEIRFRIDRQKLNREDIRDLTKFSRASMDTYQKVGVFLLAFTMSLFCGQTEYVSMMSPKTAQAKEWIAQLFHMSCVTGIGYLALSVWLAMHAVVICDSLGARLLVNVARPAVPSRRDLDAIRTSVVAPPSLLTKVGRKVKQRLVPKTDYPGGSEDEELQADMEHFLRYLVEQKHFLAYDAFSRLCMGLGINYTLRAISFYAIAIVVKRTWIGGLFVAFAFGWLMILVLHLEMADDISHRKTKFRIVSVMLLVSPTLAVFAMQFPRRQFIELLMSQLCAGLDTIWFLLVYWALKTGDDDKIPNMIRTTWYLKILGADQRTARLQGAMVAMKHVDVIKDLRDRLKDGILSAMSAEQQRLGGAWASRHHNRGLYSLRAELQGRLEAAYARSMVEYDSGLIAEMRSAELLIRFFLAWEAAPQVYADLSGLQCRLVHEHLSEEDEKTGTWMLQKFVARCQELDIGLPQLARLGGKTVSAIAEELEFSLKQSLNVRKKNEGTLALSDREQSKTSDEERSIGGRAVHDVYLPIIHVKGGTGFKGLWIDTQANEELEGKPRRSEWYRVTDIRKVLEGASQWIEAAQILRQPFTEFSPELAPCVEDASVAGQPATENPAETKRTPWSAGFKGVIPDYQRPCGWLPRVVVQNFTFALLFLKVAAFLGQLVYVFYSETAAGSTDSSVNSPTFAMSQQLETQPLFAEWPEPRRLFDVDSLHCSDSRVLVKSPFGLHVAQRRHLDIGGQRLTDLAEITHEVAIELCGAGGCGAITLFGGNATLQLVEQALPSFAGASLATPEVWRAIAAARLPCEPAPCEAARLAFWDGLHVSIASARRDASEDPWRVKPLFALRRPYGNVTALQLGADGRVALVLSDVGHLDGWDLTTGAFLGCWRLDGGDAEAAHALCESDGELVVARRKGTEGVALEVAALPYMLTTEALSNGETESSGERLARVSERQMTA